MEAFLSGLPRSGASKQAVLEFLSTMIGVTPEQLTREAGRAA
jgi:hypothetical protein